MILLIAIYLFIGFGIFKWLMPRILTGDNNAGKFSAQVTAGLVWPFALIIFVVFQIIYFITRHFTE